MSVVERLKAAAIARKARPLFPCQAFTPQSESAFLGPPPPYTMLVCMVDHRTGSILERWSRLDDRGPAPVVPETTEKKFKPRSRRKTPGGAPTPPQQPKP